MEPVKVEPISPNMMKSRAEILADMIRIYNYKEVSITEATKVVDFNEWEKKKISKYWKLSHNDEWKFIPRKFILKKLTSDTGKNAISNYIAYIKANYIETLEYKIVTQKHPLVQEYIAQSRSLKQGSEIEKSWGGHNAQFVIVTWSCLKHLLISAKTSQGKRMRIYFIKIETLASTMFNYNTICKDRVIQDQAQALASVGAERDQIRAEIQAAIVQRDDLNRQNILIQAELSQNCVRLARVVRQHIPASQVRSENVQTVYLVKNAINDVYKYRIFALRHKSKSTCENYIQSKQGRVLVKKWVVPEAKHIVSMLREILGSDMYRSGFDLPANKNQAWIVALIMGIVKSRFTA